MKIVIVVEEFDPDKGYLEYYLGRELIKLGHRVSILTFGWSKTISKTMLTEGFEVVNIPHVAVVNPYHIPSLSSIAYIIRFIKSENPDIVHCQPLSSPLSLIFVFFQQLFNYKIVGSLITGEYSINSTTANLKYDLAKIITEHYLKNKTGLFFAKSDGWKKVLLQLFNIPDEKISIIPLGADSELFKFDSEPRISMRNLLGLVADDILVIYTGKIIQSKKLHILLKAMAPIIRKNHKVKLLIVGKGEAHYMEYLKDLSSNLEVSNNVIFNSWVHRTELPKYYSTSDIAVWPGSVSISIIEAASVGLPLIVKRSPIIKYAIAHENGFTFKPDNITELGQCLEKLINNCKLRNDMGKKSRLLVEQKLNWRTITHQYLDAYRSAMNS